MANVKGRRMSIRVEWVKSADMKKVLSSRYFTFASLWSCGEKRADQTFLWNKHQSGTSKVLLFQFQTARRVNHATGYKTYLRVMATVFLKL